MSSPSFDRAQELFLKAREIPADKRGAFLAQHGDANAKVRAEVEALLEAEDASPGIVDSLKALSFEPKPDGTAIAPATENEAVTGPLLLQDDPKQIDNYQILQRIGEGGLGTVYLAEQREPVVRRVALKVIKLGMDTRQVVARFEQERQALAMMDHPNIAKVLDAGTDPSGRPYFVMELVRGDAITKYCDTNKLNTRERLGLFVDVCHAVQHAHQKGIIHRDIKPSNVLVTMQDGKPIPKVIDFGIVKATNARLTEKTLFTERGQIIGTLEYMSPEQAEMSGVDIDTRSDIYSLGVLLYELLTGTTPFEPKQLRAAGYVEIQRIIREVEPPKPSTRLSAMKDSLSKVATQRHTEPGRLTSLVRGDLDWIAMKCLEKHRTRRYETANSLALDVLRHLSGEAVVAAPPSAVYKLRKFVHRHRTGVLAGGAITAALALGVIGTTGGMFWAFREKEKAMAAAASETEAKTIALESEKLAREMGEKARLEAEREAAARKSAEYESYVANLYAADASLEMNELMRVRSRLDACPKHLRGWEWEWLNASADASILVLRGHEAAVIDASLSPDGARIVTASDDSTARTWDASTGRVIAILRGHEDMLTFAKFSADGGRIVTGSRDCTVRVWDVERGVEISKLRLLTSSLICAVNAEATRILAISGDKTVCVWDVSSGNEVLKLHGPEAEINALAYNSDSTRIVTAHTDHTAYVWDAANGARLAILRGHEAGVMSAEFSGDGTRIVTTANDKTARVWDASSGEQIALLLDKHNFSFARFSNDCRCVLTSSSDVPWCVWDANSGEEVARLRSVASAAAASWPATGQWAAYSSEGRIVTRDKKVARVWDANSGFELAILRGHEAALTTVELSPDGARIVTGSSDNTVRVWDASYGKDITFVHEHKGSVIGMVTHAAFSPDSTRIVTAADDNNACVWDASSGKKLATLRGHDALLNYVVFSHDGTRIVTASGDNSARVWDASTGKELVQLSGDLDSLNSPELRALAARVVVSVEDANGQDAIPPTRVRELGVTCAQFSPDNRLVMTASWDKTACVWDSVSGEKLLQLRGHEDVVSYAEFSTDGRRITTASWDTTARLWDSSSGLELAILRGHEQGLSYAKFSLDGTRIVTVSGDSTVRVWDASSGKETAVVRGVDSLLTVPVPSADCTRIIGVDASNHKIARIWAASNGEELACLRGHEARVSSVAFSPDGSRAFTASEDHTTRVWDAGSGRELAIVRRYDFYPEALATSPDGTRVLTLTALGVRLIDSIPYRDRYPAISRARAAEARMNPIVRQMVDRGRDIAGVARALIEDASLTPEERTAGLAVLSEISSDR